ncbi:hypothetical protein GCM10028798_08930 [Humibacter antri]
MTNVQTSAPAARITASPPTSAPTQRGTRPNRILAGRSCSLKESADPGLNIGHLRQLKIVIRSYAEESLARDNPTPGRDAAQ